MNTLSFKNKLLFTNLLTALIPIILLAFLTGTILLNNTHQELNNKLRQNISQTNQELQNRIFTLSQIANALSTNEKIISFLQSSTSNSQIEHLLTHYIEQFGLYEIQIIDNQNKLLIQKNAANNLPKLTPFENNNEKLEASLISQHNNLYILGKASIISLSSKEKQQSNLNFSSDEIPTTYLKQYLGRIILISSLEENWFANIEQNINSNILTYILSPNKSPILLKDNDTFTTSSSFSSFSLDTNNFKKLLEDLENSEENFIYQKEKIKNNHYFIGYQQLFDNNQSLLGLIVIIISANRLYNLQLLIWALISGLGGITLLLAIIGSIFNSRELNNITHKIVEDANNFMEIYEDTKQSQLSSPQIEELSELSEFLIQSSRELKQKELNIIKLNKKLKSTNTQLTQWKQETEKLNQNLNQTTRRLKRKIWDLSTLSDISSVLSSSLDSNTILRNLLYTSAGTMVVDTGAIMIFDDVFHKELVVKITLGLNALVVSLDGDEAIKDFHFGQNSEFVNMLDSLDIPFLVKELRKLPNARIDVEKLEMLNCHLCIPIKKDGKLRGVLTLGKRLTGEEFDEDSLFLLKALANEAAVAIHNAELYQNIEKNYFSTVQALANAVDAKDEYTRGHSMRVTEYSVMIARELGLSAIEVNWVKLGALLHDIGKIGISDAIIRKKSKLTDKEFAIIKSHPVLSAYILEPVAFLEPIIPYVRHHHERMDGTGYPDGLVGEEIPLGARIIAVADTCDAIASDRPYRSKSDLKDAIEELKRCAGSQFDSNITEAFIEALERQEAVMIALDVLLEEYSEEANKINEEIHKKVQVGH